MVSAFSKISLDGSETSALRSWLEKLAVSDTPAGQQLRDLGDRVEIDGLELLEDVVVERGDWLEIGFNLFITTVHSDGAELPNSAYGYLRFKRRAGGEPEILETIVESIH